MRMDRFACFAAFAAVLSILAPAAQAETQNEEPILIVTGRINAPEGEIAFTRAALEALPVSTLETSTIWTEGRHEFTGVALADLLKSVGAPDRGVRATALNDYSVEIPAQDAAPGAALIAYKMDGAPMSIREKGPLWIVYPFDSQAKFRTEVAYSRSIWQLDRIEVLE